MAEHPLSEHPSETRQLSSDEARGAVGGGPPWWVVVAAVIAIGVAVALAVR